MNTMITDQLMKRCNAVCELCNTGKASIAYAVSPENNDAAENEVALCDNCYAALEDKAAATHWYCLAGSIWSEVPSVQALSYRLLYGYKEEEWAQEIISSVEPGESIIHWALTAFEEKVVHLDSNGNELHNGDTIVLTQGLNVKGVNFMAPKGTIVRKIRLVPGNPAQIEGKINGQIIVILTRYVRKS